jgi:hypothetical protein
MSVNMGDLSAFTGKVSPVAGGKTVHAVEVDVKRRVRALLSDIQNPGAAGGIFDPGPEKLSVIFSGGKSPIDLTSCHDGNGEIDLGTPVFCDVGR